MALLKPRKKHTRRRTRHLDPNLRAYAVRQVIDLLRSPEVVANELARRPEEVERWVQDEASYYQRLVQMTRAPIQEALTDPTHPCIAQFETTVAELILTEVLETLGDDAAAFYMPAQMLLHAYDLMSHSQLAWICSPNTGWVKSFRNHQEKIATMHFRWNIAYGGTDASNEEMFVRLRGNTATRESREGPFPTILELREKYKMLRSGLEDLKSMQEYNMAVLFAASESIDRGNRWIMPAVRCMATPNADFPAALPNIHERLKPAIVARVCRIPNSTTTAVTSGLSGNEAWDSWLTSFYTGQNDAYERGLEMISHQISVAEQSTPYQHEWVLSQYYKFMGLILPLVFARSMFQLSAHKRVAVALSAGTDIIVGNIPFAKSCVAWAQRLHETLNPNCPLSWLYIQLVVACEEAMAYIVMYTSKNPQQKRHFTREETSQIMEFLYHILFERYKLFLRTVTYETLDTLGGEEQVRALLERCSYELIDVAAGEALQKCDIRSQVADRLVPNYNLPFLEQDYWLTIQENERHDRTTAPEKYESVDIASLREAFQRVLSDL